MDVEKMLAEGYFDSAQETVLREGLSEGLDVSLYANRSFASMQMQEIRLGMLAGVSAEVYAKLDYDWFQMREIRLGMEDKLDVRTYANPKYHYRIMQEIRMALATGTDLMPYVEKGYDGEMLREIRIGIENHIQMEPYIKQGYDSEQIKEIRIALEHKVPIDDYITPQFLGVQIAQISLGAQQGLDVRKYANILFDWRQMREIREGLEKHLDVSKYADTAYDWQQMKEIRMGLLERLDVNAFSSVIHPAEDMEHVRETMEKERENEIRKQEKISDKLPTGKKAPVPEVKAPVPEVKKPVPEVKTPIPEEKTSVPEVKTPVSEVKLPDSEEPAPASEEAAPLTLEEALKRIDSIVNPNQTQDEDDAEPTMDMDECCIIEISRDKMLATMELRTPINGMKYSAVDLMSRLDAHGVKCGIDKAAVMKMANEEYYDRPVEIAHGKEARNGKDGYYEFDFDTEFRSAPTLLEDGSIDYYNTKLTEAVVEGQQLVRYIPAGEPQFGYDVTGGLIKAKKGNELPMLKGRGFLVSEDKKVYTAALSGSVQYEQGKLLVSDIFVHNGDVTLATGNVLFKGAVNIRGSVLTGMKVEADGDVTIDGTVEAAVVISKGNVTVRGGICGNNSALIRANGNISAKFIESATIEANGNVTANNIMHSQITAQGKVLVLGRNGAVVGGVVRALFGAEVGIIGGRSEVPTTIEIGFGKEQLAKRAQLNKAYNTLQKELDMLDNYLRKGATTLKQTNSSELMELLKQIQQSRKAKSAEFDEVKEQLDRSDTLMAECRAAVLFVRKDVYVGTTVRVGNAQLVIANDVYCVTFKNTTDKVLVFKNYEAPKK